MEAVKSPREIVIGPEGNGIRDALRQLNEYRDLIWVLAAREVRLRYSQTALGILWVLLQPLAAAIIFSVIFGRFAGIATDGIPYPAFAFCAMVLWNLNSQGILRASESIIGDEKLITKIYFPRIIIPVAAVGASLVDFLVALLLLVPFLAFYGYPPRISMALLPLLLALQLMLICGVGSFLAALNVRFRDFRYTIPFVTQIWLYLSPVVYPSSLIPESYRSIYFLNPMVGMIETFRYSMTGAGNFPATSLAFTAVISVTALCLGANAFRRVERSFADFI